MSRRSSSHSLVLILALTALAVGLAAWQPSGVLARQTFQSSPPRGTGTSTATATRSATATAAATVRPELAPTKAPTAAARGGAFLPAPTLTSNDAPLPGLAAGPQPPLAAPAAPLPQRDATPSAAPGGVATLIDGGVVALSYLWLCCGALLLIGAALAAVWLGRRRRPPTA